VTGADLCVNKCKQSRSYLNHLVLLLYFIRVIDYAAELFKEISCIDSI